MAPDRIPARWLRIVVPAVLLILWLLAASFGGPTFGKLSSVSSNDQASFLPASAESTKVADIQKRFRDSDAIPAIVLVVPGTKIQNADLGKYATWVSTLQKVPGVQKAQGGAKSSIAGPIPSKDLEAVEYIVPVADTENVDTVVADLRSQVKDLAPSGAKTYVTGPAGLTADLVAAFGGIDGILLLVAVGAVLVILLAVYRSVVLPFLVLATSIFALSAAILLVYAFAKWGWISLSGQSQGILSILVIGAATDYSLLLVARYREALTTTPSRWVAILRAWRAALEPIVASGVTVILALLCLLLSDLKSNQSLGPIAAIGIVFALLAALTLLPVLLALFGRVAFWPFRPRLADSDAPQSAPTKHRHRDEPDGLAGLGRLWAFVGGLIGRRPRPVWIVCVVLLGAASFGVLGLKADGVPQTDVILTQSNAVDGQKAAGQHFPDGAGSPIIVATDAGKRAEVLAAVKKTAGIASASFLTATQTGPATTTPPPLIRNGRVLVEGVLTAAPDSAAAEKVVSTLRDTLPSVDSGVLVGGVTATALDTNQTAQADLRRIIPIVLGVILIVLILLLRAVVAPLVLIGTVILSYLAALGISALVFDHLFGFPGADAAVPLFGFVFLVALGIDYNIFLMTRVREEAGLIGTRPGILRGLGVTGGVITSAGVVLAATFAALSVIPILFLVQIAFIVAFGVLLDTILVRSLLVPALSYDIGRALWWPSRLDGARGPRTAGSAPTGEPDTVHVGSS